MLGVAACWPSRAARWLKPRPSYTGRKRSRGLRSPGTLETDMGSRVGRTCLTPITRSPPLPGNRGHHRLKNSCLKQFALILSEGVAWPGLGFQRTESSCTEQLSSGPQSPRSQKRMEAVSSGNEFVMLSPWLPPAGCLLAFPNSVTPLANNTHAASQPFWGVTLLHPTHPDAPPLE